MVKEGAEGEEDQRAADAARSDPGTWVTPVSGHKGDTPV
jgi:hypothetical protein